MSGLTREMSSRLLTNLLVSSWSVVVLFGSLWCFGCCFGTLWSLVAFMVRLFTTHYICMVFVVGHLSSFGTLWSLVVLFDLLWFILITSGTLGLMWFTFATSGTFWSFCGSL